MKTRNLVLFIALLSLPGCGMNKSIVCVPSQIQAPEPPAAAKRRCLPPPIEAPDAPLAVTDENDAIFRGDVEQCMISHNAALDYFDLLRKRGYLPHE